MRRGNGTGRRPATGMRPCSRQWFCTGYLSDSMAAPDETKLKGSPSQGWRLAGGARGRRSNGLGRLAAVMCQCQHAARELAGSYTVSDPTGMHGSGSQTSTLLEPQYPTSRGGPTSLERQGGSATG